MVTKFNKAGIAATLRHAGFKSISLADPTVGFRVTPDLHVTFHLPPSQSRARDVRSKLNQIAALLTKKGAVVTLMNNDVIICAQAA